VLSEKGWKVKLSTSMLIPIEIFSLMKCEMLIEEMTSMVHQ
jgi:hypothetical protein